MAFKHRRHLLLGLCFSAALLMSSCDNAEQEHAHVIDESYLDGEGNLTAPIDIATHQEFETPTAEHNENVVLVKASPEALEGDLGIGVKSIEPLYPNAPWHRIELDGIKATQAVRHLRSLNRFDQVDYDYVMAADSDVESIDISGNPDASSLPYIESMGIGHAWAYGKNHNLGGKDGGGSPDVVVAVIDTGVDYNHLDLRHNIWTNAAEIPNNGIDDDGNGYIDDVHGWDCVNEDNDPMDDNGHGTHVAGIVAAENNNIGTVGVAFNCKVMPVKAGNSSGSFNNADIAQAIQYAYMNGASVINMSFGGPGLSLSVQDALADAYNQCALVAAAGNSALCNQPDCPYCEPNCLPFYPGSIPYVVGVMSCNAEGAMISGFSNYDHAPYHYNSYEYDTYACGESVISTWPNNKLASLSGTSMASPVVAGIAALLRSAYPDREAFSNKFIHSQLTNTGTKSPYTRIGNSYISDQYHPVCDAYEALTRVPSPHVHNLYRWYAFDDVSLSSANNGDGFIDAGETIKLGVELTNRGGKATDVTVKIDTIRNNDPDLTDPNIQILEDTVFFDEIGTYSTRDGGKIYDGDKVIGMENAFLVKIADNAPNGYVSTINLRFTYRNGLIDDHILYKGDTAFGITISSGYRIRGTITEDTVFTANRKYVVSDTVTIPAGVTVTFEEGCEVEFYSTSAGYIEDNFNSPVINVFGSLLIQGSKEKPVTFKNAELYSGFFYMINRRNGGTVSFDHAVIQNMLSSESPGVTATNCVLQFEQLTLGGSLGCVRTITNGQANNWTAMLNHYERIDSCYCDFRLQNGIRFQIRELTNSVIVLGSGTSPDSRLDFVTLGAENIVVSNNAFVNTRANSQLSNTTPSRIKVDRAFSGTITFENNAFLTDHQIESLTDLNPIEFYSSDYCSPTMTVDANYFHQAYRDFETSVFLDNYDSSGHPLIDPNDSTGFDPNKLWPYIQDVSVYDSHGNKVRAVDTQTYTARVTFSKAMDTSKGFSLFYGSWEPYADYKIQGDYVSPTVWEGSIKVKSVIEGGKQFFSSKGGVAADNDEQTLIDTSGAFGFDIDTSSAFAMNLQASAELDGVHLTWVQDDYDTLMGYNVYRSQDKDGNYVKLNTSVVPAEENTFVDDSCEPGQTYWYTFTVVLSDFSESTPAGKVAVTPIDTISPTIYHTPVNQGYAGNNLVISCSASDNVAVTSVTLYYRTIGETEWKNLPMSKLNDRYNATIFGSEVTLDGLEYYIAVSDGRNIVTRGSADNPYTVIVKDASTLNDIGDVDDDGAITTKDALMIIRAIADELILTDDQFRRADLNKDEVLSTFEALRILQYINGNVTTLEM